MNVSKGQANVMNIVQPLGLATYGSLKRPGKEVVNGI